ncbi:hypothetical protein GF380_01550 [Candidatus Uhrbacteria bacterium]|nr:hypothetical protein [Candidatus Uhrbacteria bacterium]MBD3283953.1 hypothetical protein [Candidatus Uhrbacteria bacterium]
MRTELAILAIGGVLLVGGGCQKSEPVSDALQEPKAEASGFIDRRQAPPPTPPANIPPPTPVHPETTTTQE